MFVVAVCSTVAHCCSSQADMFGVPAVAAVVACCSGGGGERYFFREWW